MYSQENKFYITYINDENCLKIWKSIFADQLFVSVSCEVNFDVSEYVLTNKK